MKTKKLLTIVTILSLVWAGNLCFAQTAEELLPKAIQLEEVKGELEVAIEVYQTIITKFPENKPVAAKAQFHIGICYEKLGLKQAQKAYEEVVNNYPDQKNEVALAKERLSRLLATADNILKAPLEPKFTKIKIPTKPGNGVISPDGKKLAYIFEKSLWVLPVHGKTNRDIAGEPVRLTDHLSVWDLTNMGIVWSANNKWLAFYATVISEDKRKTDEIFIISAEGGDPVKVQLDQQRPEISGYDYRMSLSPDGKKLAFVNHDDNKKTVIYTKSVEGGSSIKLTGPNTREPAFSPDGKLIAYVKFDPINRLGDEIWVVPSEGGNPVLVCKKADVVKSPVWSPDGSMIAFLSREYKKGWANNSNELWIAPVNKRGEPVEVSSKISLDNSTVSMLSGWSRENKIGFWLSTPETNVLYTVQSSGGQAMQVTPKNSWMPNWSPDGQYLFFDGENTNDFAGLESIPVNGGEVTKISINSEYAIQPGMPTGGISVSPDGKTIVFAGFYNNINDTVIQKKLKGNHIMIIPFKGGEPVLLTTNPESDRYPVWSPDGESIAFIRIQTKTENDSPVTSANIYTIPANGGIPKKITSDADKVTNGRIDWSADGKWIGYFSADNAIKVTPSEGGDSKVVVTDVDPHPYFGLSFSPEGDKIVYSNKKKLISVDINGKNEVEVKTGLDGVPSMPAWSPDGEKIAFCAYTKSETDLWLMEDFLPLEKLAQKEDKEFNIRQVWADYESYSMGAPSPDGRYISYVMNDNTGVLGILEIATGGKLLLTNKGSRDESDGGAQYSRWSADGKQIVYDWYNIKDDKIEIRIIGIDGSKPRILYKNEDVTWAQTYGWSPDGKQILACFDRKDGAQQIVLVSVDNGSVRVLKTLEKEWPKNMNFSPDGHYIVYDFQQKENSSEHDIFLMSADGSREIPLVEHPADDYLLGWAPDGENILFASDRTGNLSAWLIAVANGKPQGTPKLVKPDIEQSVPLGFTSDGSFYYTFGGEFTRDIFSVRIDPESGEILNQPKKLIENFEGHNLSPTYSPDGKHLAYVRRMQPDILCIRSLETGEEQEFKLKLKIIDFPRWSPDGNSILIAGRGNNGLKLYQVDTQTGNLTALFAPQENRYVGLFEWSHDGKAIFYGQPSKINNRTQIIHREIESGTEKELYLASQNNRFHFSCSSDGKWLSFFMRGGTDLKIMPVEGGEPRKLFNCNQGDTFTTLRWTADGKYILFVIKPSGNSVRQPDQNKCTLWRIPAEGGEAEKLGLEINFIGHLSVHPDGQDIAYYNFSVLKEEVWKMENFLPKEETVNK